MKLSVIVPVYNVEKFLPRCLDSLLRQGMESSEWEVICVNDGSPDNSAAILADYEQKHPDIFRVVTQENQGLGGARNTGTALAKGEYVTYLDSDDYIIDNAYSYLLEHFCHDKPDVLCYHHNNVYTDGNVIPTLNAKPDGHVIFEGDGVDAYNRWPLPHVWSKFYKRSLLERYNIESEIVICQDEIFNFDVFRHHPFIRVVTSRVICYEGGNSESVQRTANKEKVLVQLNDLIYNIGIMQRYMESGDTDMLPSCRRNIDNFLLVYYKKIQKSQRLTMSEWMRFRSLTKNYAFSVEKRKEKCSFQERLVRWMWEWAGRSYIGYIIVYFVRSILFQKIYYPLVILRGMRKSE